MICVLDLETTGTGANDDIVEIGWAMVSPEQMRVTEFGSVLCRPRCAISVEAMAAHHITDAMVAEAPDAAEEVDRVLAVAPEGAVFAAHNAKFDRYYVAAVAARPWICTMKAARRVWPEAPKHTNQVLRYWRGLDLDPGLCEPAHRAGPDAYVTAHVLLDLLRYASIEQMIEWTAQPSLLAVMPFGKHKGSPFGDLPLDYLQWIVRQPDIDRDVKFTAGKHLHHRQKPARR